MTLPTDNPMHWITGYTRRVVGPSADTGVLEYSLRELMYRQLLNRADGERFLRESGLTDFFWTITFPDDSALPDEALIARLTNVQGYVVFVHGWTGNHAIWEELPANVCLANRELVCVSVDHNGFGGSAFEYVTPELEACNPPAAMRSLQKWIDLMKFRRQAGMERLRVINFVGHSMGGAMLFYLDLMQWRYGEVTRTALAPALLLEDENLRLFYTTLGLGIGILQRLPVLEIVERFIKPAMLNTLVMGASQKVKDLHSHQYGDTARGVTGATFMAMGRLNNYEIARDFRLMRVMLGHRDPLVGLVEMMDLLMKLEFPASHLHVVPGTHYMFSVGTEHPLNAMQHAQNREMVVHDVLDIHAQALQMQQTGYRIG